ncbi:MAG: hypothetical protein E6G07_04185 [Actinobacteria bacterium]|nr:MAG: hypothetical protein E6G07_04185 [Actinomycetota bacterium]
MPRRAGPRARDGRGRRGPHLRLALAPARRDRGRGVPGGTRRLRGVERSRRGGARGVRQERRGARRRRDRVAGAERALAEQNGGRARTFLGRAGTGDLVATALAPSSRNRSAGELLAAGVPAAEIPERLGQAVESLETVSLLARAIERAGISAPITSALARLIEGTLPLDEWVALVRVSQPESRRRRPGSRAWWRRFRARLRAVFGMDARL